MVVVGMQLRGYIARLLGSAHNGHIHTHESMLQAGRALYSNQFTFLPLHNQYHNLYIPAYTDIFVYLHTSHFVEKSLDVPH